MCIRDRAEPTEAASAKTSSSSGTSGYRSFKLRFPVKPAWTIGLPPVSSAPEFPADPPPPGRLEGVHSAPPSAGGSDGVGGARAPA
eukprot:11974835-Alexandrium_andersonii.AAC.1